VLRRRIIHAVFSLLCGGGSVTAIYVGYELFHHRPLIFWVFSAYILIVAGIMIFLCIRLINTAYPKE